MGQKMPKKIVVLDDYENSYERLSDWTQIKKTAQVKIFNKPIYGQELLSAIQDAHALVLMRDRTPLKADLIAQLPQLEYVVFTGTRNLALDAEALKARNIPISHTEWGPSKDSTAELTWALILGLHKRLVEQNALLMNQEWRNEYSLLPMLKGQTIGLIGLGEIGGRVAKVASAFGMKVLTWSPNMTAERAAAIGATATTLNELLKASHIVSLHIVAGPSTKGILNKEKLSLMRKDALLINTSRSTLVDTPALIEALEKKQIGGAAIDVFDQEPLSLNHPLRQTPNTLLTPHLGFVAQAVFESFTQGAVECLEAWLDEKPIVRPLP
jgi:phosphoglycerate dehydrogenase-like enzyme